MPPFSFVLEPAFSSSSGTHMVVFWMNVVTTFAYLSRKLDCGVLLTRKKNIGIPLTISPNAMKLGIGLVINGYTENNVWSCNNYINNSTCHYITRKMCVILPPTFIHTQGSRLHDYQH